MFSRLIQQHSHPIGHQRQYDAEPVGWGGGVRVAFVAAVPMKEKPPGVGELWWIWLIVCLGVLVFWFALNAGFLSGHRYVN